LDEAGTIISVALQHFRDARGVWYDTADDAEQLFTRPRSEADNAEPAGQSAIAGALLTYAALTGSVTHHRAAGQTLDASAALATREPRFGGWTLAVAEAAAAGPLQVAVVGDDETARSLASIARRHPSPGLVTAYGMPDQAGVPLLADRPLVRGGSAAYVCRGFVCDLPVTDPAGLAARLADPPGPR
ncbi:MAG: hypothetical protein ABI131_08555, partial [Nostocoides sp.]